MTVSVVPLVICMIDKAVRYNITVTVLTVAHTISITMSALHSIIRVVTNDDSVSSALYCHIVSSLLNNQFDTVSSVQHHLNDSVSKSLHLYKRSVSPAVSSVH